MLTIINNETDPLYNLALEEYVLKHLQIDEDILLIWQNRECVIIGKDQNPFRDINFPYTHSNKIPIYRRLSSGENIYQDEGTINYSFIVKNNRENYNNFSFFIDPVINLLKELGIPTELVDKRELCLEGKRFSTKIQTYHRYKMIHPGVLFFNTDLNKLKQIIKAPKLNEFEFDKLENHHKDIINLKECLKDNFTVNQFKQYLLNNLIGEELSDKQYLLDYIDKTKIKKIAKEKYSTWEWNFGESADFIIKKEYDDRMMITLIVKKGIIDRVSIDSFENVIALIKGLEGCRFNESSLKENLQFCSTIDIDKLIKILLY